MARRIALVLALSLIGGPFAGNVCDAFCEGHAEHHACAAHTSVTQSLKLIALPRGCAQVDAVFAESRPLTRTLIINVVAPVLRVTPPADWVLPTSEPESRHGPPASVRSALPLRI